MSTTRQRGYGPLYTSGFQTSYDKGGTRERLAADMEEFDKAGGLIEVLGVTPLRRKPAKPDGASKDAPPVPPTIAAAKLPKS
ncbi:MULTISPECIES: hypothetical protein [unclassified Lysobacter]|uniref:hypothetical protein n=1 Tax=unclassified Lysobacter TaxID=2635362 RepID=UPI001C24A9F7|nr:hypothetical protein [Lysobacter sp. MMG2]MBU8974548.1 hypothetical protein [Lysobacter sp. MMG2]